MKEIPVEKTFENTSVKKKKKENSNKLHPTERDLLSSGSTPCITSPGTREGMGGAGGLGSRVPPACFLSRVDARQFSFRAGGLPRAQGLLRRACSPISSASPPCSFIVVKHVDCKCHRLILFQVHSPGALSPPMLLCNHLQNSLDLAKPSLCPH